MSEDYVKSVAAMGDLTALSPEERGELVIGLCKDFGLDPRLQPFDFMMADGGPGQPKRLKLYANRSCTDQLTAKHSLSLELVDGPRLIGDNGSSYAIATARITGNSRVTMSTGACDVAPPWIDPQNKNAAPKPKKNAIPNALMTAETKAYRRGVLRHCGLGILDETEVETISGVTAPMPMTLPTAQAPQHQPAAMPPQAVTQPPVEQATAPAAPPADELAAARDKLSGSVARAYARVTGNTNADKAALIKWFVNEWNSCHPGNVFSVKTWKLDDYRAAAMWCDTLKKEESK